MTSFRWVRLAWFADLEREFGLVTGDEAVNLVQGMMDLVREVNELAGTLVLSVVRQAGLELVLEQPDGEPPTP